MGPTLGLGCISRSASTLRPAYWAKRTVPFPLRRVKPKCRRAVKSQAMFWVVVTLVFLNSMVRIFLCTPNYDCLGIGNWALWAAGLAQRVPRGHKLFLRRPFHLWDALQDVRPWPLLLLHPPLQPFWLLCSDHLHPWDDPDDGQCDPAIGNVCAPLHPTVESFQGGQSSLTTVPTQNCRWPGIGNPCRTCSSLSSPQLKQSPPCWFSSFSFLASLLCSAPRLGIQSTHMIILSSCLGEDS